MLAAALAIALMCASLPAAALTDTWNPSAALMPFTLLIFLAWSLACGEHRWLPLTVLVASFVAQCHFTYVLPTLGVVVVGLAGLVVARRWTARTLVVSAVVALACWSGPLIDQATNRPGNLVLVARAATANQAKLGADPAARAVVHAVGVPPWWLREPQVGLERIVDLTIAPGALAVASTLLILAGQVALAALGARRRRLDVVAAAALGLVLCLALAVVTASTPRSSFSTLGYSLRWAAPAGMWVWLALGWGAAALAFPAAGPTGARARAARELARRPAVSVAGLALVVAVGGVVGGAGALRRAAYPEMQRIADRLDAELPARAPVRVAASASSGGGFMAAGLKAGTIFAMRRQGRAVTAPGLTDHLGAEYGRRRPGERLVVVHADERSPGPGRVIASFRIPEPPEPGSALVPETIPRRAVTVTVAPPATR